MKRMMIMAVVLLSRGTLYGMIPDEISRFIEYIPCSKINHSDSKTILSAPLAIVENLYIKYQKTAWNPDKHQSSFSANLTFIVNEQCKKIHIILANMFSQKSESVPNLDEDIKQLVAAVPDFPFFETYFFCTIDYSFQTPSSKESTNIFELFIRSGAILLHSEWNKKSLSCSPSIKQPTLLEMIYTSPTSFGSLNNSV